MNKRTSRHMESDRFPNLFIIGAMKCGTTSLHQYLNVHVDIGMVPMKEVDFFSGRNSSKGLNWYLDLFDSTFPVRGESSQNYSKAHDPFHCGAPQRMAQVCSNSKLIYLVRDPIERYRAHIVENYVGETEEIIKHNLSIDTYVKTGLYHYQLQEFLKFFSMDQILVVDSDDLRKERLATMNRIFDFIGVARIDDPRIFDFEINVNGEDVVPPRVQASLPYRAARRLAPGLLSKFVAHPPVRRALFAGSYKAELGENDFARLADRFAPDVAALRSLTGQRFAGWQV